MSTLNPNYIEQTSNGSSHISLSAAELTSGIIHITGEITDDVAQSVISQIMFCKASKHKSIHIVINSGGGSVSAGLAIYDALKTCGMDVHTYCFGIAASMAAVLFAAGDKGFRLIMPHSQVMIHEPLIAGGVGGAATSIAKTAESILKTKAVINGILADCTGKTTDEIDTATQNDRWFTSDEAIGFGLADKVTNDSSDYHFLYHDLVR